MIKYHLMGIRETGDPFFITNADNNPIHWDSKDEAIRAGYKCFKRGVTFYVVSVVPKPSIIAVMS